jgi:hypothetical protein
MKSSTHKGLRPVRRYENETLRSNFEQVNDVLEVRDAEHDLHLKCNQCQPTRKTNCDEDIHSLLDHS